MIPIEIKATIINMLIVLLILKVGPMPEPVHMISAKNKAIAGGGTLVSSACKFNYVSQMRSINI